MNEMVTIPREEYDRLRTAAEDLADLHAYDRAMAEGGESIPHEYVARMIAGESPVRVLRDWRGITASGLARAAGIHRVQVHDIETGKKRGSVETLSKLAGALGVTVDDLI